MSSRLCILSLWFCFIALLSIGLVMVASTSTCVPVPKGVSPYLLLTKQIIFSVTGLAVTIAIAFVDYRILRHWTTVIWVACTLLLICCFVPGIGLEINGESRWIKLGFTFQPSEIAKIGLIICLANWYSNQRDKINTFTHGFLIPGIIFGVPVLLILFEKDMGTAAILGLTGFCLMFVAGARWWQIVNALIIAGAILFLFTTSSENRMSRIDAWHDPQAYSQGAGRQQWISTLAFARGGETGVGLGSGVEKFGNLTFAHTDFIFAEIGEEFGFVGSAGVILLFLGLCSSGLCIAFQTQERFGRLLAIGLSFVIFWPAMLNTMVVTSVLPNSGLPLPFISCGGTNLIFTISAIGLLTSIHRFSPNHEKKEKMLRRLSHED